MKKGKLFGYVQCDTEVPENLRSKFNNVPTIFKNTLFSKINTGDLIKNYAEEERLLSQPRKMLISSFTLQNGTLNTLLLLFYLQSGLVCKIGSCSYGYQIMDRSRHTVRSYLSDEKTHAAINSKLFKKLDHVNKSLYEVELAKAQIEHKEPIFVGFFILQYAKLRNLELYYKLFTRFCDANKFEELEMDTDSLYLALAEKELEDCMRPEMRAEWQRL